MYLDYYGLDQAPFSITPDPRFVFLSDRHRDALAHLVYGISQGGGGGFVQLTGEVGTGKTTLSRLLLEQLPDNTRVALVLNPRLDPVELLEAVCEELGLDIAAARGSGKTLVDALNRYLLQAHADGQRVVLMLDEAQEMSVASLEQVRLLTNLETATQKLLQIVLLGQPELRGLLERPDLRQLAQRITARYHLTPLTEDETAAYVRHRLAVAGLRRSPFDAGALKALYRRSGGVPRVINVVAERALLSGYAGDRPALDRRLVERAADEVLAAGDRRPESAWSWLAGSAVALTVVVAVLAAALVLLAGDRQPATPVPAAEAIDEMPAIPEVDLDTLLQASGDGRHAAAALLERWRADPALAAQVAECPFRLADNLHCLRSRGTLAQLGALDRPVLLLLPDGGVVRALALVGLDADAAQLVSDGAAVQVPRATLENAWPGEYLAIMNLPGPVAAIAQNRLPDWAQTALARFESNRSLPPLSQQGERIRRLQQSHGLRADAVTGPETWWVLSAHLTDGPRLAPDPAAPVADTTNGGSNR